MTVPSSQRHTKKIRLPQRKKKQSERKKRPPPENSHWLGFCQRVRMSVWAKKLWEKSYRRAGFTVEKVDQTWQQVSAGMMWKLELKSEGEAGAAVVSGCMFMWSSGVYKNVLNAIMEDGEATVLGLRRSKPLFFSLGGSFSYSKQPHKRLPVSLATSPSDLGPFISLPSLSMTCPHQGSYKISPFPMKHQQTFWRVWLSPRWISGVSTPPPQLFPPLFPPPPPIHPSTHRATHPSLSLSPPPTPPLCGRTSDPQHLLWRAVVTETQSETRGEPLRRGKRALSHFLGGASVVDGKRMHCGLLEEPDMDSTGQSC